MLSNRFGRSSAGAAFRMAHGPADDGRVRDFRRISRHSQRTLTGHAHHFAQLPPYEGHTSSGRVRGWQGSCNRIKTVERHLSELQHGLVRTGIDASSRLARHAAQVARDPQGADLVEAAWRDAWLTLTDRAQVRTLLEPAS